MGLRAIMAAPVWLSRAMQQSDALIAPAASRTRDRPPPPPMKRGSPGAPLPPPAPSWGVMIEEARDLSTLQAAPHALIFPGLAIALTVLAFNFVGDGLREYLDPRQRRR